MYTDEQITQILSRLDFAPRKNGIKKNKNFFVRLILVWDVLIFGHFKLVRIFYAF